MHTKAVIRKEKIAQRLAMPEDAYQALSRQITKRLLACIRPDGNCVAMYSPIRREVDISTLVEYENTCLPVISPSSKRMAFRRILKNHVPEINRHGIMQPPEQAPAVLPDIVIVPLVAFDRRGFRIGYGGGYYDVTLDALREEKDITAIGIAFASQEVAEIPAEPFDHKLDAIITEKEILEFAHPPL
jgi:5-formyltetrahydrofolate cyclo-ligase